MTKDNDKTNHEVTAVPVQVVHPGTSKEIWDEALKRSGLDPADVTEYNTQNKPKSGLK